MKQNDIEELPQLSREQLETIFSVYQTEDGMYFYDIMKAVSFPQDLPVSFFKTYTIKPGDTWPLVSYRNYNTTALWWLILHANDIRNPMDPLEVGTNLLIPIIEVVKEVLAQLSTQNG